MAATARVATRAEAPAATEAPHSEGADAGSELERTAREIMEALRVAEPAVVEGLPEDAHELTAMLPRSGWKELGRLATKCEVPLALDGSKWVSLRLDGCLWGTLLGRLRAAGVVDRGYSEAVGEAMCACCRAVLDEFKGTVGYTHSDEMTVLLAPRRQLENGQHVDFPYNGRVQKWVSIAASVATALFNRRLGQLAAERGIELDEHLNAHFDCRVGVFDSELEATSLLLWRAYDCGVNCAQDACYHQGSPPELVGGHIADKLRWLHEAGHLPMKPHQAYGSLFVKGIGEFEALSPDTNETVRVNRTVNVHVNDGADGTPRSLLNFLRRGLPLLPGPGDPRMALREGSFWRYAGPSGAGPSNADRQRSSKRRRPRRNFRGRRPRNRPSATAALPKVAAPTGGEKVEPGA